MKTWKNGAIIGGLLGALSFFVFIDSLNENHPYEVFLVGTLRELFRSTTGCQYDCLYFLILFPLAIGIIGAFFGTLIGLTISRISSKKTGGAKK